MYLYLCMFEVCMKGLCTRSLIDKSLYGASAYQVHLGVQRDPPDDLRYFRKDYRSQLIPARNAFRVTLSRTCCTAVVLQMLFDPCKVQTRTFFLQLFFFFYFKPSPEHFSKIRTLPKNSQ